MVRHFQKVFDWRLPFAVSAFFHAVGLSSLLIISAPASRSLRLSEGRSAIEKIVVDASFSMKSSPTSNVEFTSEPPEMVREDDSPKESLGVEAQEFSMARTEFAIATQPFPVNPEAKEPTLTRKKVLPKRMESSDDIEIEIEVPEKLALPRTMLEALIQNNPPIPMPAVLLPGAVEKPSRIPLKTNQPPRYPLLELQSGIEGRVVLRITIEPRGIVSAVEIEKSSGFDGLDRAAMEAVVKWQFEPADSVLVKKPEVLLAPIVFNIAR